MPVQEKSALEAIQTTKRKAIAVGTAGGQLRVRFVSSSVNHKAKEAVIALLVNDQLVAFPVSLRDFPAVDDDSRSKLEIIVSLASVIISALGLVLATKFSRQSVKIAAHALHLTQESSERQDKSAQRRDTLDLLRAEQSALIEVWGRLGQLEHGLRFHDISPQELDACEITKEELAYLVASFEIAYITYQHSDDGHKQLNQAFPPGSLRYNMCRNPSFRRAVDLIVRFFPEDTIYVSRIKATAQTVEDHAE